MCLQLTQFIAISPTGSFHIKFQRQKIISKNTSLITGIYNIIYCFIIVFFLVKLVLNSSMPYVQTVMLFDFSLYCNEGFHESRTRQSLTAGKPMRLPPSIHPSLSRPGLWACLPCSIRPTGKDAHSFRSSSLCCIAPSQNLFPRATIAASTRRLPTEDAGTPRAFPARWREKEARSRCA